MNMNCILGQNIQSLITATTVSNRIKIRSSKKDAAYIGILK